MVLPSSSCLNENALGRLLIEGQGRERARIAFATVKGDQIIYTVEERSEVSAEPVSLGASSVLASRQLLSPPPSESTRRQREDYSRA